MKKLTLLLLSLVCLLGVSMAAPIKVACIGDSITYGLKIENREQDSYPAQLNMMLGEDYNVDNFGVSGATMIFDSRLPYNKTKEYQRVFKFQPDIIFICLGTNDSCGMYREKAAKFESDYKKVLAALREGMPKARIILLTPPKAFCQSGNQGIDPSYIEKNIVPSIRKIAYDEKLEVINLQHLFGTYDVRVMPDRVHPSSGGATLMALRLNEHLSAKKFDEDYKFDSSLTNVSNYYGYQCYNFNFEGKNAKIVVPKKVAEGRPWLWRARFWGHKPDVDIALLERGFHLVYSDVANMYGSPKAVAQWEKFYDFLTKKGLNKKCAIEAMSRGGLIAYNYAAKNPETVAVIYADAPVLDFKSWPMNYPSSIKDTEKMLDAYGFKTIEEAKAYKGNPIDKLDAIVKGGFDMVHVCGLTDVPVPPKDNTLILKAKLESEGRSMNYLPKPKVGHVHGYDYVIGNGLVYPEPVVRQILMSTSQLQNAAVVPTPGFRNRGKFKWADMHQEMSDMCAENKYDILLLGNSITDWFASERKLVSRTSGKEAMNNAFPKRKWLSAGISADRTQHLLYRILNGGYEKCNPKYVVLTIGINNLGANRSTVDETEQGILACVKAIREKMPKSKLILYGALPAQNYMKGCIELRERFKKHDWDKMTTYVDGFQFLAPDGNNIIAEYYLPDKLHLNEKGYEVWTENMKKYIK